jgi:excisionase family DNA binding protein
MGVVVAVVEKLVALVVGQGHRAALGHRVIPPLGFRYSIIPILVVKTHQMNATEDRISGAMAEQEQLCVNPAKAARMLGLSVAKTYLLMAEGQLPFIKIGRSRRITVSAVKELIERCTVRN